MTTNEPTTDTKDEPDARFIEPVRQLLAFYDDLIAGTNPPITELDNAITGIRQLTLPQGQLGNDINLIANGGKGASRAEIVAALGRLRALTYKPDDDLTGAGGDQ